jgi:hypothetical protein
MSVFDSAARAEIEALLEQRRQITEENLDLLESCQSQGSRSIQREIVRGQLAAEHRETLGAGLERRPSEARINQAVASDHRYQAFYDRVCRERREYLLVKERLYANAVRIGLLLRAGRLSDVDIDDGELAPEYDDPAPHEIDETQG